MISGISTNICNINPLIPQRSDYGRYKPYSLPCDTVSFTSKNFLRKPPEEIAQIIRQSTADIDNILGHGEEGFVYNIPDTGYCVKILNGSNPAFLSWSFDITSKEKVNHIVAKTGDGAFIMKKIEGEPVLNLDNRTKKEICCLPFDTYKDVILQVDNAFKKGMSVDSSGSNMIYNKANKTFTVIDFFDMGSTDYYSPFYDVFGSIRAWKDADAKKINRKLGESLLGMAVREISTNNKDKIPLIKRDFANLYTELDYLGCVSPKITEYMRYIDENLSENKGIFAVFSRIKTKFQKIINNN